jgi:hypothetical protein
MIKNLFALSAVLSVPAIALAQEAAPQPATPAESSPLSASRPDFTEGADILEPGQFQLEGGVTAERSGGARAATFGELVARIGLNSRTELRVGIPSYISSRDGGRATGLDDAALSAKYVLSSHPGRATALILGASLPTGSKRVAEREFQPQAILAAAYDLSDRAGLGLSAGYGRPSGGGVRFNQFFASAELGYSLSEKVGSFAEVYAYNRTEAGGRHQQYGDAGLTYALNNNFQLDARFGLGLWNRVGGPDYFYGVGAAHRF